MTTNAQNTKILLRGNGTKVKTNIDDDRETERVDDATLLDNGGRDKKDAVRRVFRAKIALSEKTRAPSWVVEYRSNDVGMRRRCSGSRSLVTTGGLRKRKIGRRRSESVCKPRNEIKKKVSFDIIVIGPMLSIVILGGIFDGRWFGSVVQSRAENGLGFRLVRSNGARRKLRSSPSLRP